MSETLPTLDDGPSGRVEKHQATWELQPLLEMVKGRGVLQTGYALKLFGRFDDAAPAGGEAGARRLHGHLNTLALDVVRSLPVHSLLQAQPFGRAVVAPGSDARPIVDVEAAVIASPPHPGHPLPPAEVRRLIAMLEEKLGAMGLKRRT